jgi:hypothetical protein
MEDAIKYKTELQMQAECCTWFWNEYPGERQMLHANDNNSYNAIEGAKKKALGVVKGISDLEFIGYDRDMWFIELKLPGEKQLLEQIKFQQMVELRGFNYIIIFSFVEFKRFILKRLYYGTLGTSG